MKKLLFAFGAITALLLISSCSADDLQDVKTENTTPKNQFSPSAVTDTINSSNTVLPEGISDKDKNQG
jgi:hypothetical protein